MLELIAGVLLVYALVGEPVWGLIEYRRLRARREDDPRALVRFYRLVLAVEWGYAALVFLAVAASGRLDLAAIGVGAPGDDGVAWSTAIGVAVAVLASGIAMRRTAARGRPVAGQAAFDALLPRTREERRLAAAVAVTAGICEEVLYRGFFIAAGVLLLGLPIEWAAVAAGAIFVVAHVYQGWVGLVGVTGLAVAFTVLYLRTGSLLLPVALHALVDLRALVLVPRVRPDAASPSSPG